MDEPGAERRGRGREDEGAAAVDEEVAGYRGGAEQGALGAERLAAGVKGDQIVAAGEAVREAGAAGAEHAGGVRLIDHEDRSEEHTSELQSLMRISYAVFCFKNNNEEQDNRNTPPTPRPSKNMHT